MPAMVVRSPILGPPDPWVNSPFASLEPLFRFQLRLQNWTPFQSPKIHPKSPKKLRKPSPRPLQNGSKTILILETPKIKKNATLPYENLIFDVHRPSKIVPKSMQKRLQNQLYVGYPLGTLKNTILDVKTSPRWTTKISEFFQQSSKNSSYYGLWSKMPLGSLQEPPKSLPRAVPDPSRCFPEPSRSCHSGLKNSPTSLKRVTSESCRFKHLRCQVQL